MNNKNNKWPFSIILDGKKSKLKDQLKKISQNWKMSYSVLIITFIIVGALIAFYQQSIYQTVEDYNFQRTSNNQRDTSVEIIGANDDYDLGDTKLSLPEDISTPVQKNQEADINSNKDQSAIKVDSNTVPANTLTNLIRPTKGEVILSWHAPYKDRILDAWKFNSGVDFKAEIGAKIKAAQTGIVEKVIKDDYQGITIIIKHNNTFQTLYANLQKVYLNEGQQIKQGQVLGEVGDCGIDNNSRLHFEVIKLVKDQKKRVSPLEYIN